LLKLRNKTVFIDPVALSYCTDKYGIIILFVIFFVYLSDKKNNCQIMAEAAK